MENIEIVKMKDGMIKVDSEEGKRFGFTSDRFFRDSYLWKREDVMFISFIAAITEGKGYFSNLLKNVDKIFEKIIVPTPSNRMYSILKKKGYVMTIIDDGLEKYEAMTKGLVEKDGE